MSYQFDTSYIWGQSDALGAGLLMTLKVSAISILAAVAIGILGAIVRVMQVRGLSAVVAGYVSFIRNTPLLVQIFFIFYGLPSVGIHLSIFNSGVLALVVWGAAYNVENVRGGLLAVPDDLRDAGAALGLKPIQFMLLIAVPLGVRVALPSVLNTSISILKNSAYLQAIGLAELTFVAMERISLEFRTLEMFAAIGIIYLALVLGLSIAVRALEKRLHRPFETA